MDALKITFASGESLSFPFGPESTLAIETPDGVNGSQRGVWGDVANVEYVKATDAPAADTQPVEPVAPPETSDVAPQQAPDTAPVADTPAADPQPAEAVAPDPQPADSSTSGATDSTAPATTSAPSSTDSSTGQDASLTSSPTPTTDTPAA